MKVSLLIASRNSPRIGSVKARVVMGRRSDETIALTVEEAALVKYRPRVLYVKFNKQYPVSRRNVCLWAHPECGSWR